MFFFKSTNKLNKEWYYFYQIFKISYKFVR